MAKHTDTRRYIGKCGVIVGVQDGNGIVVEVVMDGAQGGLITNQRVAIGAHGHIEVATTIDAVQAVVASFVEINQPGGFDHRGFAGICCRLVASTDLIVVCGVVVVGMVVE